MADKEPLSSIQDALKKFNDTRKAQYSKYFSGEAETSKKTIEVRKGMIKSIEKLQDDYWKDMRKHLEEKLKEEKKLHDKHLDDIVKKDKERYAKMDANFDKFKGGVNKVTSAIDGFLGIDFTAYIGKVVNLFAGGIKNLAKITSGTINFMTGLFTGGLKDALKTTKMGSWLMAPVGGKKDEPKEKGKGTLETEYLKENVDYSKKTYFIVREIAKRMKIDTDALKDELGGVKSEVAGGNKASEKRSRLSLIMSILKWGLIIAAVASVGILLGNLFKKWFGIAGKHHDEQMALMMKQADRLKAINDNTKKAEKVSGLSKDQRGETGKNIVAAKKADTEFMADKEEYDKLVGKQHKLQSKAKGFLGGVGLISSDLSAKDRQRLEELEMKMKKKNNRIREQEIEQAQEKYKVDAEHIRLTKEANKQTRKAEVKSQGEMNVQHRQELLEGLKKGFQMSGGHSLAGDVKKYDLTKEEQKYIQEQGQKTSKDEPILKRGDGSPKGKPERLKKSTTILAAEKGPETALFLPDNKLKDFPFMKSALDGLMGLMGEGGLSKLMSGNLEGLIGKLQGGGKANLSPGKDVFAKDLNTTQIDAIKAIDKAAQKTGEKASDLKKIAYHESKLKSNATNPTSSAKGLFQFINDTWNSMIGKHGGKYKDEVQQWNAFDPYHNALMGAEFLKDNKMAIGNTGRLTDAYLAHFLGAGGAKKFLSGFSKAPQDPAADYVGASQAMSNYNIFYGKGKKRSLLDVYSYFQKDLDSYKANKGISVEENKKDFIVKGEAGEGAIVDKSSTIKNIKNSLSFTKEIMDIMKGQVAPNFQMNQLGRKLGNINTPTDESKTKLNNVLDKISNSLDTQLTKSSKATSETTKGATPTMPSIASGKTEYKEPNQIFPTTAMLFMYQNFLESYAGAY